MPVQHGVWGIDIGQCGLKALRLELVEGVPSATAFDYVEHPKILSQPDADPDQLVREALEQFLSRNTLKGDHVAIAVPGGSGLARFVKLPPVEESKMDAIVRFEAKQQIPFPLEEVVWDYQKIGAGEVAGGFAMEAEIGLFAMKRDMVARQMQHFQDVGVEVHTIQMAPLSLCNYLAFDWLNKGGLNPPADEEPDADAPRNKRRCAVALDIGADSSNLVVTDGEKVIWQRPIPLGGNHMTRALSKEMKITFAKAEHLKRNAAKSPELKQILTALKPVLNDFAGEVQRSLGFFTTSHRDAHVAYMVGLGNALKLPGFQKFLSEKLGLEIKRPAKMNRLTGSDDVLLAPNYAENILSFAPAYGLALQGLGQTLLRTNLLPPEIRMDRMIRAKKPWALTAASLLLLGTGVLAGGYAASLQKVSAEPVTKALKQADGVIKDIADSQTQAKLKEAEVEAAANDVKSIIAGKEEQINWIALNGYINKCLPRPDGSNLHARGTAPKLGGGPNEKVPDQTPFWNTTEAKDAQMQYYERLRGGQSADVPIPEEVREHLCMVDIEAFDTVYSGNLKLFFDTARTETIKQGKEFDGMLKYDIDNPPKDTDKGWIVALRGSTHHKAGRTFVVDALVHNLASFCQRTFPAPGTAPAAPATPAPLAPGEKPTPPPPLDPLTDRVTNVFLYNCWTVPEPQPGVFNYITKPVLRELVKGDAAGSPGSTGRETSRSSLPGQPGAADQPTLESWKPLTGVPSTGGASDAGRGLTPPDANAPAGPNKPKVKPRYEFIVVFVWREPTPSDVLFKPVDPNAPR